MDFFLSRYRNLTVLLIVIVAQLLLIAYQVKSHQDVALIRVWAVTAVTPVEQALEFVRRYTWGFVEDYFVLLGVRIQNEKLKNENGQLKLENHYLKSELTTADRARALSVFQAHSPSKTVAVRVIGNGTGANSKVVFVDRGSTSGIESGMAVVTPDGIVGKVVDAYPTASLVMLITDPTFAAGVVSQKNRVRGTLKGVWVRPSAWWITRKTKRRWTKANGSTLPVTIASFRAAFRWARSRVSITARPSRKSTSHPLVCKAAWKKF